MRSEKRTIVGNVVVAVAFALLGGSTRWAIAAGDHCFYKGSMFSDGAAACQAGQQYRCDDGDWKKQHTACVEDERPAPSRACDFKGVAYSTGSASCQGGTQYRCEDGRWSSLGITCPVGDSPIRVVPEGRTCMFDGATVANNSTICRSGSTYLCTDGEWLNVGTLCR
jgi:hypothetical protein